MWNSRVCWQKLPYQFNPVLSPLSHITCQYIIFSLYVCDDQIISENIYQNYMVLFQETLPFLKHCPTPYISLYDIHNTTQLQSPISPEQSSLFSWVVKPTIDGSVSASVPHQLDFTQLYTITHPLAILLINSGTSLYSYCIALHSGINTTPIFSFSVNLNYKSVIKAKQR